MKRLYLVAISLSILFLNALHAQCVDGGNGADGGFHATIDTSIAGNTYNYTTFTIDAGVTVSVTGTAPLIINCTGAVNIAGTLTVSGANGSDGITYASAGIGGIGVAGGGNGGDGSYSSSSGPLNGTNGTGPGSSNNMGMGWSGGGGAGYSTPGDSSGGIGGFGGPVYGDTDITGMEAGSGGGGGSGGYSCGAGGGGAGGGIIKLSTASTISILSGGSILSNGGNGGSDGTGNCGGGGGGSGGSIILVATTITNNGTISCLGGIGGASTIPGNPYFGTGANGANGRIRLDVSTLSGSGTINPAVGSQNQILLPNIGFTATPNDSVCPGTSLTLSGTGGVTYSWTGGVNNGIAFVPPGSGMYVVEGTDSLGCTNTDTINVIVNPLPVVNLGANIVQPTSPAILDAGTGFTSYAWSTNETTQTISVSSNGTYIVSVTNAEGCSNSDTVQVTFTSGIGNNHVNSPSIQLYPNPSNGNVNLIAENLPAGKITLQIMDLSSKVIYIENIHTSSGNISRPLNLTNLSAGIYLVNVVTETKVSTIRMVISK